MKEEKSIMDMNKQHIEAVRKLLKEKQKAEQKAVEKMKQLRAKLEEAAEEVGKISVEVSICYDTLDNMGASVQ